MFSDQVQIVSPGVKPENWHLVTPFFDFNALRFWKHLHVIRHERCSYLGPDVFPAPLQLFHELADKLRWVFFHRCVWANNPGCPRRSPRLARVRFQSWACLSAPSADSYPRTLQNRTRSRVGSFAFEAVAAPHLFPLLHTLMPRLRESQQLGALLCVLQLP